MLNVLAKVSLWINFKNNKCPPNGPNWLNEGCLPIVNFRQVHLSISFTQLLSGISVVHPMHVSTPQKYYWYYGTKTVHQNGNLHRSSLNKINVHHLCGIYIINTCQKYTHCITTVETWYYNTFTLETLINYTELIDKWHWYWILGYTDKYSTATPCTVKYKELDTVNDKSVSETLHHIIPIFLLHKELTCIE